MKTRIVFDGVFFLPQKKCLWWWIGFGSGKVDPRCTGVCFEGVAYFNTLEEAKRFLEFEELRRHPKVVLEAQ